MRRKSPIHAIVKPPNKQSSNNNSSCTMKEAITNISHQLKFYFFFPNSVEITVAVEPYESLGEHSTEGGIELILPLFDNEG
jgi:hypothetical protein